MDFRGTVPLKGGPLSLAALPVPSFHGARRTVRFQLPGLLSPNDPDISSLIETLGIWSGLYLSEMHRGSVVFVVGSEEERKEALEAVGELDETRRSKFSVEVDA